MPEILTHWKRLHNPDYLGAYSLDPGKDMILTIDYVRNEMVTGSDGKKEECTVAHFSEKQKPMILNVTNMKAIASAHGTPYIEEWRGKKIQIFATMIKAFGEEVEALRIRPKAPQITKPVFDQNHKGWTAALEALSKEETTIDYLTKKYSISDESLTMLKEAVPNA